MSSQSDEALPVNIIIIVKFSEISEAPCQVFPRLFRGVFDRQDFKYFGFQKVSKPHRRKVSTDWHRSELDSAFDPYGAMATF
ncbi:uncharacterized protein Dyak_GE27825 [Drosophila yakuba]|uniref:Uncharacterized protein n=1 Tax=Drosophila yakuba TaxID=7245 RepID=A0A0R1E592_DROYA|nr:uncharacterized protein Dyak_GE27825 [Drosophila yakuba]